MQFLSMKLAAVNPRLDFTVDDLFEKEVMKGYYQVTVFFFPSVLAQFYCLILTYLIRTGVSSLCFKFSKHGNAIRHD